MGRLVHFTPSKPKPNKCTGKTRSSLSEEIFRKALNSEQKRGYQNVVANTPPVSESSRKKKIDVSSFSALKEAFHQLRSSSPTPSPSDRSSNGVTDDDGDGEDEDWLNSSNTLAQYDDPDSATEEERLAACLEELRVTSLAKAIHIKRDLCNIILQTLNDIRQTHVSIDRGVDMDRGKGIVIFNSACEKWHSDIQQLEAELQDDLAEKQAELKRIFGQLKQCYATRQQLWEDFEARILQITNRQTEIAERCEREMAQAMANYDKKYGPVLKEETLKSKEKLLRDVLDKL